MDKEIAALLKEHYDLTEVRPEMEIKKDLGLSSFDLMNLICIVEEHYHIELEEERYRALVTVSDVCDYVAELTGQGGKA
ncbi:MAG: acyl carrier protein [Lachnospiraceae bacterium]|nr:acyl carrier protein [Lachnospiraceae bacterium]